MAGNGGKGRPGTRVLDNIRETWSIDRGAPQNSGEPWWECPVSKLLLTQCLTIMWKIYLHIFIYNLHILHVLYIFHSAAINNLYILYTYCTVCTQQLENESVLYIYIFSTYTAYSYNLHTLCIYFASTQPTTTVNLLLKLVLLTHKYVFRWYISSNDF